MTRINQKIFNIAAIIQDHISFSLNWNLIFLHKTILLCYKGTSINDITRFLAIFDLPTYYSTIFMYKKCAHLRNDHHQLTINWQTMDQKGRKTRQHHIREKRPFYSNWVIIWKTVLSGCGILWKKLDLEHENERLINARIPKQCFQKRHFKWQKNI